MLFTKSPKMDNKILEVKLNDIRDTVETMFQYLDNEDVLRFYAGKISVLSKELVSMFIQ